MLQDWPVVVYGLDQWDLLFIQHCMVTMLYEKEVTMLYAEKLLWSRRHTNHCIRMPVFWDLKHCAVCCTENPRNVPLSVKHTYLHVAELEYAALGMGVTRTWRSRHKF